MDAEVRWFPAFEQQVAALGDDYGVRLLTMTAGPARFFDDLRSWHSTYPETGTTPIRAHVLPDPALSLAFPYPGDELAVAHGIATGEPAPPGFAGRKLEEYGLRASMADQPTLSLSGGERLLVALAKADVLADRADNLVACSPTAWLHESNYSKLTALVHRYTQKNRDVRILALQGEPMPTGLPQSHAVEPEHTMQRASEPGLDWHLEFRAPLVTFKSVTFPRNTPERNLTFAASTSTLKLRSPTLLVGTNGVGKSVLARVLSGQLRPTDGGFAIKCEGFTGPARLILQDSVDQLFGASIEAHLARIFRFDDDRKGKARELYDAISNSIAAAIGSGAPAMHLGPREHPTSILQVKIALAAERLVSGTPLLIIDEPEWCLSRFLAVQFMAAVCKHATERKTAVLIISHYPDWWEGLANSTLVVTATTRDSVQSVLIATRD